MSSFSYSAFLISSTNSSSRLWQQFSSVSFFEVTSCNSIFKMSLCLSTSSFTFNFFLSSRYTLYLCLEAFVDFRREGDSSIFEGARFFFCMWSIMSFLVTIESWLMLTLFTDLLMLNPRSTLACPWFKTNTNLIIDWISGESRRLGEWKKNLASLSFSDPKHRFPWLLGTLHQCIVQALFLLLQTKWSSGKGDDEGGSSYLIVKNPLDQRKCTKVRWQYLEKTRGFFRSNFWNISIVICLYSCLNTLAEETVMIDLTIKSCRTLAFSKLRWISLRLR